jgi:hypothetical protein
MFTVKSSQPEGGARDRDEMEPELELERDKEPRTSFTISPALRPHSGVMTVLPGVIGYRQGFRGQFDCEL